MSEGPLSSERYVRVLLLGEGGAGRVWLARDGQRPGSPVALKEILGSDPARASELRQEFATLASLQHPNLVEVFELDRDPESGLPRFTMEWIEGKDIVSAVREEGVGVLLDLAAEALRALSFLHDFGLIHRDLKPGNLLVRDKPRLGSRLVVLDFGLALRGEEKTGGPAGTLAYLAPEILDGAAADRRSDLYALGAVLFEAAHGKPPYAPRPGDLAGFVDAVRTGKRARPSVPEGLPSGFGSWLDNLLSPDASERPAEASEALARLNAGCGVSYSIATPAVRAARLGSGSPPGREKEIAAIWEQLEAPTDKPRLVWLCGNPGSGKTRILRWLASDAVGRDHDVAQAESEFGGEAPVAERLAALRERAAKHPLLLLVDEVERATGRIAQVLERVAREGKAPPLRIVAAVRHGELRHPGLRKLLADTGIVPTLARVDLEPFEASGIRAVAERATGSGVISEARVKWLLEASDGSPALAEALLVEGAWEKGGRTRKVLAMDRVSDGRLDLLSPAARRWLEALAVLGERARDDTIARLAGQDEKESSEAAAEASAAGLARRRDGTWTADPRSLAEQLVSGMDEAARRASSARAAEIVEEVEGEEADPWRLARLRSRAGDRERAIEWARRAGKEAEDRHDPLAAAERYAFAASHAGRRDPARAELRLAQAEALMTATLYRAAVRAYAGALRGAATRAARADLLSRRAYALSVAGNLDLARRLAEEALPLAREAGEAVAEVRAARVIGIVLARSGHEREALPHFERALEAAERSGDLAAKAEALQSLAVSESNLRMATAAQHANEAIPIFARLERAAELQKCLLVRETIERGLGDFRAARRTLQCVMEHSERQGNLDVTRVAVKKLALLEFAMGRFDRAAERNAEALEASRHLGNLASGARDRINLAETLFECGRPAEAAMLFRTVISQPSAQVEPDTREVARALLSMVLLESDDPDSLSIASLIEDALLQVRRRGRRHSMLLALSCELARSARFSLLGSIDTVWKEFQDSAHSSDIPPPADIHAQALLAYAISLLSRGRVEEAKSHVASAVDLTTKADLPSWAARAEAVCATTLRREGRSEEADRAMARARDLLQEAASRIEDPAIRKDFLARRVFREIRESESASFASADRRLVALYDMIRALNSETDPEALLETSLDLALGVVEAERGMILLRGGSEGDFSVRLARNLEKETAEDAEAFSRSVVAQAGAGKSVLTLDAGHDERFQAFRSVSLYRIRSLMCVPLRSRGKIIGTVYVDSRREGRIFTPDDLRFLEAFADHAALALENARARADLERENRRLQAVAEERSSFGSIVGRSAPMQAAFDLIEKVAASELPVLILGESGTGKELVARAIHFNGPRKKRIFLSENCAAIPESLLESELFGHVRGAFTGAEKDRAGLFEQADGGTLFLDEIADMSASMQARLLRALQEGEIRRVGGSRPIHVDVRVLAATNRDLQAEVEAGRFREDLFYRLHVLVVALPPLRKRPGDIELLAGHFLEKISRERGRTPPRLASEVLDLFERYAWPGNVRQLENTLQRLALLAGEGAITRAVVESDASLRQTLLSETQMPPVLSLEHKEREMIRQALDATKGNREKAAKMLGISRATIYRKIKEYQFH